ncbi:MAG: kelch repeat-containing protein, partial [Pseudomonadota bacterium]
WRTAAPMPQGQGGLAAGVIAGSLFAFGGEFFSGDGGVYPELWAYAPETDTWSRGPDMRRPRHGHGAVSLDGFIYAIGGALKVGADETSGAVDRFTLP